MESRASDAFGLVVPAAVATAAMCRGGVGGFGDRHERSVAQTCGSHQNERRNDTEGQEAIERGKDGAEIIAAGTGGKLPDDRSREKSGD